MNINELFYFKTVQCGKKEVHNYDVCYFYHYKQNDKRRMLIDVGMFVKLSREENEEEIYCSDLKMYGNHIGSDAQKCKNFNDKCHLSPCINEIEHRYHILNFNTSTCSLDRFNIECFNEFCAGIHKEQDRAEGNGDRNKHSQKFKDIYLELIKSIGKINTKDITEILHILRVTDNKYIDSFTLLEFLSRLSHKDTSQTMKIEKTRLNSKISRILYTKKNQRLHEDKHVFIRNCETPLADNTEYQHDSLHSTNSKSNTITQRLSQQICIKTNIFDELRNIPILTKETIYSSVINTDEQIVYLSNSLPRKEELNQLIIAMLNSHNGVIIYGVDVNTNQVTGIKMNSKARDLFRQNFNGEYKSILIEYENCIKYKFYGLDDPMRNQITSLNEDNKDVYCIIVFKIKKIKDKKIIFDPNNRAYTIKPKFLKKYEENKEEKIKISDIKLLNMKSYIEIMKEKLLKHYKPETKENIKD